MTPNIRQSRRRRGAAYVMVMAISLLVATIGIAALTAVRVQLRTAANSGDAEDARVLAQSGVEWVRAMIYLDPNWRVDYTSGSSATVALGGGSFTAVAMDPLDNDFSNSPYDSVRINVAGYKGRAKQTIQTTLTPNITSNDCLNAAIFAGGAIASSGGTISGGLMATNSNVVLSGSAKVDANVEAVGTFSGTAFFASRVSGVPARKSPDATAFDYYIRNGTAINYASTGGNLDRVLLTPGSNPYGATNPNGIYVIDCGGAKITVKDSRIVGTLVLLNVKSDSVLDNKISIEPYVPNFPALMVKGTITFQYDPGFLSETTVARNFNPPGSPYKGLTNLTQSDSYPSGIQGLVYVSGSLSMKSDVTYVAPLIVGGTFNADHNVGTTYDSSFLRNPPPGFFDSPMKPSASSWAQTVD
jgi:hypothetical protein